MQDKKFDQYIESLSESGFSPEFLQEVNSIGEKIITLEKVNYLFFEKVNQPNSEMELLPTTAAHAYFVKEYNESITKIQNLIKHSVLIMCNQEQYVAAFELLKALLVEDDSFNEFLWIDSELIILYIFLDISTCEISLNQEPILSRVNTMESIKNCYYRLKFLMRRVQYSLSVSLQKELVSYLQQNKINLVAVELLAKVYMRIEDEDKFFDKIINLYHMQLQTKAKNRRIIATSTESIDSTHIFSFIVCVNNDVFFDEILHYINSLKIPKGYAIEVLPIYNATSMTSGYNEGMNKAIGKYKIYLHQDVFLINKNLLLEVIQIFGMDDSIGMIGVAGCESFVNNGVWWQAPETVKQYKIIYSDDIAKCINLHEIAITEPYVPVVLLDGLLLITSKDLPWREDLFHGFHHYDVSQSLEFRRHGYQCVIPKQEVLWALHEQEYLRCPDVSYEESRKIFLSEYSKDFAGKDFNI